MNASIQEQICHFWLEDCTSKMRFQKSPEFDRHIGTRFGVWVERALLGELDSWEGGPRSTLALVLVLDQFTRNIYRETPRMIAGDVRALRVSVAGVKRGLLEQFSPTEAQFFLMPMMHAEDLQIQQASLPLFEMHCGSNVLQYAVKHRDIIQRFGRFPHRNRILGRTSTPDELLFLEQPGSRF